MDMETENIIGMKQQHSEMIRIPRLFMSARTDEDRMTRLFIAGLNNGVRGFDTAREYRNEKSVGRALARALSETGIERKDVFVQSRISNEEIIKGRINDEVKKTIDYIGLGYLDCFMFHWPTPDVYLSRWNDLVNVLKVNEQVRSIGLCNPRLRHLNEMEKYVDMMPQIVQIEITPFWQAKDIKDYCDSMNIKVQAFSPLCKMISIVTNNEVLNYLAGKYGVTIPQIILKWNVQRTVAPISMTSKESRIMSNFDIDGFTLQEDDMNKLAMLDCGYKYHLESATCVGF